MTDFETASIHIANCALYANYATVVVAIVAGWVIYRQLKSAQWSSLLLLEQDMAARRREFLAVKNRLKTGEHISTISHDFSVLKESYLNALDRLASSVLNGNFPQKEMKQDYRDYISEVVRDFPSDFATGTAYRKTIKLYEKWQD